MKSSTRQKVPILFFPTIHFEWLTGRRESYKSTAPGLPLFCLVFSLGRITGALGVDKSYDIAPYSKLLTAIQPYGRALESGTFNGISYQVGFSPRVGPLTPNRGMLIGPVNGVFLSPLSIGSSTFKLERKQRMKGSNRFS